METLYSIVFFIVALGVLITFHEYGHYWVARKLGVSVLKFSIGFGPSLFKYRLKNRETEYVVAAIPLGGYVKMLDETHDEVSAEDLPRAFNRQPLIKRSAIVAAGPIFNFLLAGLLYWAVFLLGTEGIRPVVGEVVPDSFAYQAGLQQGDLITRVDGKENRSWRHNQMTIVDRIVSAEPLELQVESVDGETRILQLHAGEESGRDIGTRSWEEIVGAYPQVPVLAPVVGEVVPQSPAEAAGMQPGDRIAAVDGDTVESWRDLVSIIGRSAGKSLMLAIERADGLHELAVAPDAVEVGGRTVGRLGITVQVPEDIGLEHRVVVRYGPVESLWRGIASTWEVSAMTIKMLGRMLDFSQPTNQLGGPVTIARYAGQAAQAGVNTYLTFLALLSISLGILNLLPIPVLDGGHLMFHLYEAVVGSPPSDEAVQWAYRIGIAMLAGIMALAFYNDFVNLF